MSFDILLVVLTPMVPFSKVIIFYFFQAQLYSILEVCRAFDRIFKEHLDGG